MVLNFKSIGMALGLAAVAGGLLAANAGLISTPRAQNASSVSAVSDVPGVVVVATPPTINEVLDIILGEAETELASSRTGDEQSPAQPESEVARVAAMLGTRTGDRERANRIATALVREGRRSSIGSTLLVGLLLTENPDLDPRATSPVGARGLMQVMPFHAGNWGCPSGDLFDIDSNICHGVRILADNLRHSRDLPAALFRYNGCVRGTNTPDCYLYAGKVYRYARKSALAVDGKLTAATPFAFLNSPRPKQRGHASRGKGRTVVPRELLID